MDFFEEMAAELEELDPTAKVVAELREMVSWNDFAASLVEQYDRRGSLSEKQVAAAERMLAKMAARREAKEAAKAKAAAVDLSRIEALMSQAREAGYKKPIFRAEGLRVKYGRDDALLILNEERTMYGMYGEQPGYEGKVVGAAFHPAAACAPGTIDKLAEIAKDPMESALRYGNKTGRCACCGRELTKHDSVEAGIGPICASKWGLA